MTDTAFMYLLFGFGAVLLLQLVLTIYTIISLHCAAKERTQAIRDLFGLVRKIEGLTATKREQLLMQFDQILETMQTRLPTSIAARASDAIFQAEKNILTQLAELEPKLAQDDENREKMDELIKSMENLETTMVALTSDTVHQVMIESRRDLFEQEHTPLSKLIEVRSQ